VVALLKFPGDTQLDEIIGGLWKRSLNEDFPNPAVMDEKKRAEADRIIGYGERVVDRVINKARGILPFNSIVIAAFSFERTRLGANPLRLLNVNIDAMILLSMALLAASSILCLWLMLVRFGSITDYASYANEIKSTIRFVKKRAVTLEVATILSLAAVILGIVLIAIIEFAVGIPPKS
jgi:hypothetical protein